MQLMETYYEASGRAKDLGDAEELRAWMDQP